jgi:hypothetical protein
MGLAHFGQGVPTVFQLSTGYGTRREDRRKEIPKIPLGRTQPSGERVFPGRPGSICLRFEDFEHGALLNYDYEFIIGEPDQTRKAPVIEYEDFMNPIVRMLKKSTDAYVPPATPLWTGGKESRNGLIVPELIFKYGNLNSHVRKFPRIARWLIPAVIKRFGGYSSLKKNPARPKIGIDEQTLADLKDFAVSLGCHQIGFAEVPKKWVFKEKSVLYSHAIVLTMPMEKERMARAPQISARQGGLADL